MTVKTFISRPLLSIVISVFIVLLGVISLLSLPVERYPDIAPPAIYVWASYPGASAETVHKSVVMPLEEAINGVEGMTYMTSSASNGSASITIYFEQGANADMAAVNVQNRVIQAQAQLPAEVLQTGVATEKRQPGQLRIIALESRDGTYDENFLSNYFYNNLRPALLRIKGVGKVEVWGAQYALRIWLKPDVMARHKLMPSDISAVLAEQNLEASVGSLGSNSDNVFQYMLRYTGRKTEVLVRGPRDCLAAHRRGAAAEGCGGCGVRTVGLRLHQQHQRASGRDGLGEPDGWLQRHQNQSRNR